jgi:hypothetical protein
MLIMSNKNLPAKNIYPYARLTGMKEFMAFVCEPNWKPTKIDVNLLKKLAIARGKEYEAIKALHFLGIVDETGSPTAVFDELKLDYPTTLRRIIYEKYADLFNLIPTRMANQKRLVNFFETAQDTAEYQAKLFVWLCEQAGIELPNVEKRFHRSRFDKRKETLST